MKRKLDDDNLDKADIGTVAAQLPKDFRQRHTKEFGEACDHILKVDNTLLEVITRHDFPLFLKKEQATQTIDHHFAKLASAIFSQQISGAAAKSIKNRFMTLFGGEFPSHKEVYAKLVDPVKRENVRGCGLSARKVLYLESLTEYFLNHEQEIEQLFSKEGNDDEIVAQLTKNIKGIGPWSANMFLITGLGRMNVFTSEDLGIARGCSNYLSDKQWLVEKLTLNRILAKRSKIKHKKLNWKIYDEDIVELCAERFAPFRTVLMFILWRLSSTNVEVMAKNETDFVNK